MPVWNIINYRVLPIIVYLSKLAQWKNLAKLFNVRAPIWTKSEEGPLIIISYITSTSMCYMNSICTCIYALNSALDMLSWVGLKRLRNYCSIAKLYYSRFLRACINTYKNSSAENTFRWARSTIGVVIVKIFLQVISH